MFKEIMGNKSLESVGMDPTSALARELNTFFMEVLSYKESLEGKNTKVIRVSTIKYFKNNVHQMKNIIEKHTNLIFHQVHVIPYPCGMFAIDLSLSNLDEAITAIQAYTGTGFKEAKDTDMPVFKDMNKHIDLKKSKITKTMFGNKKQFKIGGILYFDPCCAFLAKETIHVDCEPMTSTEITAIILHEIGHMMVMVERAGELFAHTDRAKAVMTNKPKDKKELFDKIKKMKEDLPNDKDFKKDHILLDKLVEIASKSSESIFNRIFMILINMYLFIYLGTLHVANAILGNLIYDNIISMVNMFKGQTGKSGDQAFTTRNTFMNERLADEFVALHGLSGSLNGGLHKLINDSMYLRSNSVPGMSFYTYKSKTITLLAKFMTLVMYLSPSLDMGYENTYRRLKRNQENVKGLLLSDDLPKEHADILLKEFEKGEKYFKKRSGIFTKVKERIIDVMGTPNVPNLIMLIYNGGLRHELQLLYDTIDSITKNKFGFISKKLEQIAKK